MLIKTNKSNQFGEALYQNAITGRVSTLKNAVFVQSLRRERRHHSDLQRKNQRKNHGEMFTQIVNGKKILHYTEGALIRKKKNFEFMSKFI